MSTTRPKIFHRQAGQSLIFQYFKFFTHVEKTTLKYSFEPSERKLYTAINLWGLDDRFESVFIAISLYIITNEANDRMMT